MTLILDALIIGSGALGCATAFYLTEAGIHRVGIVDRGPLVSGMTRRNAGLVHTHHSSETTSRLALQSLDLYRHWSALIGGNCGFVETGMLILVERDDASESLRSRVDMHRRLGIDTRMLDVSELPASFPHVSFQGVTGVAFEPASGYVDPVMASQGLVRRAREKGAKFQTGTFVKQIVQQHGAMSEVVTTTGIIQSPLVVITAGIGAERLLAPMGISLDLRAVRGAIGFFEQPASLYDGHPSILDFESSFFLRPHAFHLTAGGVSDNTTRLKAGETWDEVVTALEMQSLRDSAAMRLPALGESSLKRSHAILYDHMPDGHPALGGVPGVSGLYIAVGFGEDVISLAPAVGRVLADLVVDGRSSTDVNEFRLTRQTITHVVEGS
jgi:glycine/D-amino acid oxidase-like deaminating enzyme